LLPYGLFQCYLKGTSFCVFAALRELFLAKIGNFCSNFSSGELSRNVMLHDDRLVQSLRDGRAAEEMSDGSAKAPSEHASLVSLNDAADEFFDVPEPSDDQSESSWSHDFVPEISPQVPAYIEWL